MSPKELRTKWIEALRSGEYKQGVGALHVTATNEFCCLGVACDVYVKASRQDESLTPLEVGHDENSVSDRRFTPYNGNMASLPWQVAYALGIKQGGECTFVPIPSLNRTLTDFNDYERKTFNEIADTIEKHSDEIFKD